MSSEPILVIGPAWVGDMVMANSLFQALRQRNPRAPIDVLAPAWTFPVLSRMSEVRNALDMPLGHGEMGFGLRRKLGKFLREKAYAQAVVTPRSWKSALVPYFANIPTRTGFRGEMRYGLINDMRPLNKGLLTQTVQRYVALGSAFGEPLPQPLPEPRLVVDIENQGRLISSLGLNVNRPAVALMPGAEYGPAKQWPASHYQKLARSLVSQGVHVWVFGSKKEQPLGDEIIQGLGETGVNLCGRTELVDAIDLIAYCTAAVSNDSGLMHVAAATGRPLVAIYGSSSPAFTPPLSQKAEIVHLGLNCGPCFQRICPLGHTDCLYNIHAELVLENLAPMLAKSDKTEQKG